MRDDDTTDEEDEGRAMGRDKAGDETENDEQKDTADEERGLHPPPSQGSKYVYKCLQMGPPWCAPSAPLACHNPDGDDEEDEKDDEADEEEEEEADEEDDEEKMGRWMRRTTIRRRMTGMRRWRERERESDEEDDYDEADENEEASHAEEEEEEDEAEEEDGSGGGEGR
eukprot:9489385-Pyramimonas_sp.AAC.1